ncbi:hypothetical protein OAG68_02230 [bacterium]|nr:hypothetical protein [bacterium]
MNRSIYLFCFILSLAFSFASDNSQAQERNLETVDFERPRSAEDRAADLKRCEEKLTKQLEHAFFRIKQFIELTPDQQSSIDKALQNDIATVAHKQTAQYMAINYFELDRDLQLRLLEETDKAGCDVSQVAAYRKLLGEKYAYMDQVAFDTLVNGLDEYLIFSEEQVMNLTGILKENWQSEWTSMALDTAIYGHTSITSLYEAIPAEKTNSFLTPTQEELFRSFKENNRIALRGMAEKITQNIGAKNNENDDSENAEPSEQDNKYRQWLTQSFELKIRELVGSCNLSESQQKKVSIIEKAVIEQIIDRRNQIADTFGKNLQGGGGVNPRLKAATEFAKMPLVTIDDSQPWIETIPKVLDDQQMEQIKAHWTLRQHRFYRSKIGGAVISLPELLTDMNFEQQRKLSERFFQAAKDNGLSTTSRAYRGHYKFNRVLALLSEQEYKEVLTDDQWKKLKPAVSFVKRRQ